MEAVSASMALQLGGLDRSVPAADLTVMMPAALAVAMVVAPGMDADGQGFCGARAQQGQGEGGGNQLFHGNFLQLESQQQRRQVTRGSERRELVIRLRLTDAGEKNGARGDGGDTK
jgi:hypothetical protein